MACPLKAQVKSFIHSLTHLFIDSTAQGSGLDASGEEADTVPALTLLTFYREEAEKTSTRSLGKIMVSCTSAVKKISRVG